MSRIPIPYVLLGAMAIPAVVLHIARFLIIG